MLDSQTEHVVIVELINVYNLVYTLLYIFLLLRTLLIYFIMSLVQLFYQLYMSFFFHITYSSRQIFKVDNLLHQITQVKCNASSFLQLLYFIATKILRAFIYIIFCLCSPFYGSLSLIKTTGSRSKFSF